jgi:chemotaxis protein MotB
LASLENIPPIIVKKKKAAHGGHHGGAWKVAYADFVTAMMALFMVLWIVGQSKEVRESVSQYFKDPVAFREAAGGKGVLQGGAPLSKPEVKEDLLKQEAQRLQRMGDSIMQELQKNPDLEGLSKQINIEIVKEGLRIELLESSESFFFDVGTAHLKQDAGQVLGVIADELSRHSNHIILEGHTDSRQYSQETGYTNFELSADRANSARRVLVSRGVKYDQIDEVRGYADTRLRNTAAPLDASNRRISLLVKFEELPKHD